MRHDPDHDSDQDDAHLDDCIATCQDCQATCLAAASDAGLAGGGDLGGLLLDCARMCATAADFMLRRSMLHGYTCGLCAHICRVCADACRDEGMTDCADACARCADTCLHMSKDAAQAELG